MFAQLPYGLAQHTYGSDAPLFKPQRWMTPTGYKTAPAPAPAPAGAAAADAAVVAEKTAGAAAPPDPNSFMSGTRDW